MDSWMDGWMSLIFSRKENETRWGYVLRSCASFGTKKHGAKRLRDNLNLKLKGIRGDRTEIIVERSVKFEDERRRRV